MTVRRAVCGFALLLLIVAGVAAALCYSGRWIPNERAASRYPVRGIDVSHHQGSIDWPQVARADVKFAYIKATEGDSFRDEAFQLNFARAHGAGIVPGAYHFYRLGLSGEAQARFFISVVPTESWSLPPAADLEFSGYNRQNGQDVAEFEREFARFCQLLAEHYQRLPVVYTMKDFRQRYLPNTPLKQYWARNIFFEPLETNWMFWQFTECGRVPGVQGYVDLNVFRGSRPEFDALRASAR
jgi:lysozyme